MNYFSWYWFRYQVTFFWPPIWILSLLFTHIENGSTFFPLRKLFLRIQSQKGHLRFKFNKVTVESIKSQRGNWMDNSVQSIWAVKSPFRTWTKQTPPNLSGFKTVKYDFQALPYMHNLIHLGSMVILTFLKFNLVVKLLSLWVRSWIRRKDQVVALP